MTLFINENDYNSVEKFYSLLSLKPDHLLQDNSIA